jgi:D-psicose/D-tagatose/L-ribulose 3-epimerase
MSASLAISNIAWEPVDDGAVAAVLRDGGFGGVEIAPTTRWARPLEVSSGELADYRDWWRAQGLNIVALQALLFGRGDLQLFGTEAQRTDMLDYLEGIAALGGALGARALVFGSPKNRQRGALPNDEAMNVAVDFFRRAGTTMEAHGVRLCIEPNPPEYGCDFITTTADAVALVERVDHPGIALQGDLGAITIAGDPTGPVIRGAARLIAHFHASEPQLVETGTGGSDHAAAARALADAGYEGSISIEMKKAPGARVDAIARAVRLVRAAYHPAHEAGVV